MWGPDLRVEILALFVEAQRSIDRRRTRAEALAVVYHHLVKRRRRELYDEQRRLRTERYERTLARSRRNTRARWERERERLLAEQAAHNAAARAARVEGRICAEESCDRPVAERESSSGPTPRFCSARCNRRTASRNYWRRQKSKKKPT